MILMPTCGTWAVPLTIAKDYPQGSFSRSSLTNLLHTKRQLIGPLVAPLSSIVSKQLSPLGQVTKTKTGAVTMKLMS